MCLDDRSVSQMGAILAMRDIFVCVVGLVGGREGVLLGVESKDAVKCPTMHRTP